MRKAILASVILSAMFSVAQAADVKWSGDFGYRYDNVEVGSLDSTRDRFRAVLKADAKVNDKTKVVFGLRTGTVKSSWNDMGAGNSLKNVDLNLAYVEYAAAPFAKVTLGKMNRPWESNALFFDNDIKPEGLAVALKHDSGLTASVFNLKLVEGATAKDSDLAGLQVAYVKNLLGFDVAAVASTSRPASFLAKPTCKPTRSPSLATPPSVNFNLKALALRPLSCFIATANPSGEMSLSKNNAFDAQGRFILPSVTFANGAAAYSTYARSSPTFFNELPSPMSFHVDLVVPVLRPTTTFVLASMSAAKAS